ncbi:MAG: hypothetical protein COZ75_12375 [Flavobacteriaceae bacterium CG_4_8_14_3_um_filter_34_10]|nr:hypothetical protein [Flavobacteriia bacterium]OIP51348.1 MAG: hypothetical protein AUK33_04645 [Flavobacteriaceae bacterium CG2_30_34_30]PIQ17517.1 MAG: hypothetical protein COW66_11415 [Flavobacteriaceae bacterium CG18_big_fil_WC_8_21_14_2_50_34_36]PIV49660.1 MAG: hypothetical protein COS19_07520 [Flavobacteriaceae bacterium CG02_land_8_20_14_3_00_34_13]PIX08363.1 MAG: hypothetical protein COZ75_12375 [Flavobacteriaceae bacterium CG_4_8_14_3_um_filter_34_10]PIZ08775.1 MAG: hypothetical pr
METENSNNKLKWLIGILAVLLVALTVFTVKLYNDSKENATNLELQKMDIEQDLEELIANYNIAISENQSKDKDLIAARERISLLLDSVKDSQANVDLIRRYRVEVGKLKNERTVLFRKADSLQMLANRLTVERDSTTVVLGETIKVVDSISLQNLALEKVVAKGSALKVSGLKTEGVIVRNSGKIVNTDRASRADRIRTCFSLNANEIAEKGDRLLFVQVINPKNNVIGEKAMVNFEDKVLTYSATSNVFYENEALDVCVLINALEADLIPGNYSINVFDGPRLVATSTLKLK